MVDFYKLRKQVMKGVDDYLRRVEDAKLNGYEIPPYIHFRRKLVLETGCTSSMVDKAVETLVPNATVKDDMIVRRDDA